MRKRNMKEEQQEKRRRRKRKTPCSSITYICPRFKPKPEQFIVKIKHTVRMHKLINNYIKHYQHLSIFLTQIILPMIALAEINHGFTVIYLRHKSGF